MMSQRHKLATAVSILLLGMGFRGALAGPNAGGTLIMHAEPSIAYTCEQCDYCPFVNLETCDAAITSVSGFQTFVFYALGAFPAGSSPRVVGVTFGIQYSAAFAFVNMGSCADFELSTPTWPASGSGTALTFDVPRTESLLPLYWFAGYNYYAPEPASFALAPHPTQGGTFADDSIPSVLDVVAGYGSLGFEQPGELVCPEKPAILGACCLADGSCTVSTEGACVEAGGQYQGDGTNCDDDPCDLVEDYGACCLPDGSCLITFEFDCDGQGQWLGDDVPCDPNPCGPVPTTESTWGRLKKRFR